MYTPDVPTERGRVGAMGWMGNQSPKRVLGYVYRGTGVDIYEPPPPPPPKPKPKPKPKPRRKAKPRPKPKPPGYRRGDEGRAAIQRRIMEREPGYVTGDGNDGSVLSPLKPRVSRNPRWKTEWSPMTGADIDSLLDDL